MRRGSEKENTWNGFTTSGIGDGNEPLEKDRVLGVVPVSKNDCEFVIVSVHFFLRVEN